MLATYRIDSIYNTFIQVLGLFGGTLSGLFALGCSCRGATGRGAGRGRGQRGHRVPGQGSWTQILMPLNDFVYGAIGVLTCIAAGYLASVLLGPGRGRSKD